MSARLTYLFICCLLVLSSFSHSNVAAAETKIVIMTDNGFIPQHVQLNKNGSISLIIHNQGKIVRKIVIPGLSVSSPFLMEDEMATIRFTPNETGRFLFHAKTSNPKEKTIVGSIMITE